MMPVKRRLMSMFTNQKSPKNRRTAKGFTLLELVIALTLLAIFSGTLFSIVRGSVKAATEIEHVQQTNDQVNRFIALCRQTFQNLPNTAILALKITESNVPVQQELTISGVPECFPFGTSPISYKDTILGLRPDAVANENAADGVPTYSLGLSREDLIPTDSSQSAGVTRASGDGLASPDEEGRFWMPLLPEVTSLNWRFYREADDLWEEEWDDETALPQLVELNLLLKDRTQPMRVVFALPTSKLTAANPALAPATTNTTTTNNTAGNNGSGSGNGNNGGQGQGNGQGNGGQGNNGNPRGTPQQGGNGGGSNGGAGGSGGGGR
jgi:prepilin-type N-terminal cleavage/methylation domain-containing protein